MPWRSCSGPGRATPPGRAPISTHDPRRPSAPEHDAPITFGHYVIHELIGVGGMAQVYRASAVGPEGFAKPVVIKRVKAAYQADHHFIQMFIDEAKLSATLDHPHLVSVFDFGETDGRHFLAMEYVDGLNLRDLDVRHRALHGRPVPWPEVALILRDTLRGLDYAHRRTDAQGNPLGLIHRDVNLVNVLLGADGTVKLVDFGIAKAAVGVRGAETAAGVVKGKIPYMSPEQAAGAALDARSDVFAASIVMHELLTGERLFQGADDLESLRNVQHKPILDPGERFPEIPEALSDVLLRGLNRSLPERYQSAGDMADALEEIIYEHRVKPGLLTDLMRALLAHGEPESPTATESRRRQTHEAWLADALPALTVPGRGRSSASGQLGGAAKASGIIVPTDDPDDEAETSVYPPGALADPARRAPGRGDDTP